MGLDLGPELTGSNYQFTEEDFTNIYYLSFESDEDKISSLADLRWFLIFKRFIFGMLPRYLIFLPFGNSLIKYEILQSMALGEVIYQNFHNERP